MIHNSEKGETLIYIPVDNRTGTIGKAATIK